MLDICRECGIEVPSVAQVIGVDNEEYICEQTEPTLTSIEPDFEGGGYEAMRALDAMLSGKRPPAKPIIYGVRGIVERQSTRDNRGTARLVNLTLDFIRLLRHSETPIEGIAALCGYEDASFLKVLFRRTYGISMRDYRRSKSR